MAESETEKAFSSNPFKGKQTVKRLKNVARNVPVLGTAFDVADIASSVATGNLGQAAVDTGLTLAGTTPVGRVASKVFKKTVKAYKLFKRGKDKKLYPLFVDADTPIKTNVWLDAVIPEATFKAKNGKSYVPSMATGGKKGTGDMIAIPDEETRKNLIRLGFLPKNSKAKSVRAVALRGGWHAGDSPTAIHIGKEYKGQKYRDQDEVWAEVEMPNDVNWQEIANKNATLVKSGKRKGQLNVKEAQITDKLPDRGFYRYKTNPNMQGNWLISGQMKVKKILTPEEVKKINKKNKVVDLPTLNELKKQSDQTKLSKGGILMDDYQYGELLENKKLSQGGMPNQMEMAFMQDGGLQDEGGTVDKESGNDVPSGSLKKEVRDDVPAMLSEGEFVIPADVVRYIGLEKLMQMRQEAKMGLQMMEKMGQMGNSEEAEIPDDLPFGVTDIVVMGSDDDDEKKMAQGGVIYAQQGTDVPQQTDFEQMMGYEAGRGDNPYAPSRVAYKNKKGEVVYVLEDYLGRPMESTTGLTRVTPYGPEGDQPTPAPSPDPTPDDGESAIEARREQERKERRQKEKTDLRIQQAEDAMQTSAERVFPNLTPEEARSKYGELTLSQRIKLVPQEIKVMTGSDVSSEVVEDIINNPNKTKGKGGVVELVGNFITDLVSGIFKPFGIDINKTPDIKTVVKEEGNAINASDVSNNDIKFDEEPSFIQGMKDADRVAGTPPVTPSFVQGMKDADRVAGTPVVTGADNNPNLPTSPEDKERIAAKNRESSLEQYGSRYSDLGDSDESMSTFKPTVEIPQGEGGVDLRGKLFKTPTNMFAQGDPAQSYTPPSTNEQTSNMLSAAQANTSPISTDDPTFTSSVIPSKVEPVSTPSFVQGMTDADKVAGTTPERKGQIFDSVPTMFDLSGYKERQAQRRAYFNAQVDKINEGLKILEGTTLSSGDKKKTSTRKLKIDAKQGTGAFADRQRKEKDRDKRRKRQDAKKAADKRVKDYKEGKQTFRGRGGRAQGGLMKKNYP